MDAAQVSQQLRGHLQGYLAHINAINRALVDANQAQGELEADAQLLATIKGRLDTAYGLIGAQTEEELSRIDAAINAMNALEALLAVPAEIPAASKNRPPQSKKRKTDGSSRAGSPASSTASPLPSYPAGSAASPPNAGTPLPRQPSTKPHPILPSLAVPIQPTPIAPISTNYKKPSLKSRKDALLAQLPLKSGRQIAVKESKKGPTGPTVTPDNFILGRVVQCIQGDKNRYSVEDVDYDPNSGTPDGGKWNTTLKSIIPLPQPGDERTYPDYDYPAGTVVLACYPETTSFYKAIVESGPFGLNVGGGKKKEIQRLYRLRFDDDDGALRDVPIELVCEPPLP
ncbi:hypothetical protein JCM10207_002718 [Rhodosporidiobolus poonsookiae]